MLSLSGFQVTFLIANSKNYNYTLSESVLLTCGVHKGPSGALCNLEFLQMIK